MHSEIFIALLILFASAQPPPPDGGGDSGSSMPLSGPQCSSCQSSSDCSGISDGSTCETDGSSNFVSRTLSYDSSNGRFTGNIITNQCNKWQRGIIPEPWSSTQDDQIYAGTANCMDYQFPDATFNPDESPQALPLLNAAGLTLHGVLIYSAYEAGFSAGQASCTAGSCDDGVDVATCEMNLLSQCDGVMEDVKWSMFADTCGAHADPYHTHANAGCDYDMTVSGHSPLIGLALDGYGIYGLYEDTGTYPTDLDACGGHVGVVPGTTGEGDSSTGISGLTSSSVYHYHMQSELPFTLGCYGSPDTVTSTASCKDLYPDSEYSGACGAGYTLMCDCNGVEQCYDTYCPCYEDGVNNDYTGATCPDTTAGSSACAATDYCDAHGDSGSAEPEPEPTTESEPEPEPESEMDNFASTPFVSVAFLAVLAVMVM